MTFCVYVHMKPDLTPFYVGKGTEKRARNLYRKWRNKWHQHTVAKYGAENIVIETHACATNEEACQREIMAIAALRAAGVKLVNLTNGGEGQLGVPLSAEARRKQSIRCKGVPLSTDHRAKMSAAHTGKVMPAEQRAKISDAHKGKVFSQETRAKLSAALKGRPLSPETRMKMSAAAKLRRKAQ